MDLTPESAAVALAGMPSPDSVRELERHLLQLPQIDLGTQMLVHGGMCARTIMVPAGTIITGAQTNLANICILHGDITVTTDDGPKRLTGYHVLSAEAGFKRGGIAHADTWWTTIWRTGLKDSRDIENEMTSEADLLQTRRDDIEYASPAKLEPLPCPSE